MGRRSNSSRKQVRRPDARHRPRSRGPGGVDGFRRPPRSPHIEAAVRVALLILHFGPPAVAGVLALTFASCTALGFARGWVPAVTAIFRTPLLGPAAARLEDFLPHLLLSWAMIGVGAAHAAREFGAERTRRLSRKYEIRLRRGLARFGLIACATLFLFSLARSWADGAAGVADRVYTESPPSEQLREGRYSALFGFLPWSDAHGYYVGARRLAELGTLDDWNQRRPLNAALLSFRLGLTGFDLRGATVIQVLLLALCAYSTAHALGRGLGVWAGIGGTALILGFARTYQTTTLSETLGVSFGALGVGLLFRGIQDRSVALAAGGLCAMSFAMSARAGALFALPCLLIGVFFFKKLFRAGRREALALGLAAVLLGASWTPVLNRLYGTKGGMAYSNFAYTTCGLALGGSWTDAESRYAPELASLPTEEARASFLYSRTFELVRHDPRPLFGVLLKNEWQFLREIGPWLRSLAFPDLPRVALAAVLQVLLMILIVRRLVFGRSSGESILWLAGSVGVLLSVPFIRDGGWRALAASWPFLAGLVSTGLAMPWATHSRKKAPWAWDGSREIPAACLALFAAGAIGGPWITRAALSARLDLKGCPADHQGNTFLIVKRTDLNPAVGVVDAGAPPVSGIPTVERERYAQLVSGSGMEDGGTLLDPPARPFVLLCAYDRLAHWAYQLVAPAAILTGRSPWLWMRVQPWKDSRYFHRVVAYGPWEPCMETPAP